MGLIQPRQPNVIGAALEQLMDLVDKAGQQQLVVTTHALCGVAAVEEVGPKGIVKTLGVGLTARHHPAGMAVKVDTSEAA